MRQVILYTAASLDDFIAREDGGVDWLHAPEFSIPGEDFGYSDFYESIDTTIMGRKTYDVIEGFDLPFPYPEKKNYVLTRSTEKRNTEYVEFITGDIIQFIGKLKLLKTKDIWLIGGGGINSILLANNLIDKIILTRLPVNLERGIKLFSDSDWAAKFDLTGEKRYDNGFIQLALKGRSET